MASGRILTLAATGLVLLAGCGGGDDGPAGETDVAAEEGAGPGGEAEAPDGDRPGPGAERKQPPGATISTSESQFGEVLFDGDDQAIYYFDEEDSGSQPECYGECADAWPPVLTKGDPRAGGGAKDKLMGTTERRDGSLQVTYDGRPLYNYHDEGPGELRCHNVFHAGGLWLAVQPDGEPVPT